jgi:hypothetical protein
MNNDKCQMTNGKWIAIRSLCPLCLCGEPAGYGSVTPFSIPVHSVVER